MKYSFYIAACYAICVCACGSSKPSTTQGAIQNQLKQGDVCRDESLLAFEPSEQGNFDLVKDLQSRIESCCQPLSILNEESCTLHAQSVNVSDALARIERVKEDVPCLNEAALACADEIMQRYSFSPAPRSEIETAHCPSPFEACTKERAEEIVLIPLRFTTEAYQKSLSDAAREASQSDAALSQEVDAVLDTLPARESK